MCRMPGITRGPGRGVQVALVVFYVVMFTGHA
jgi:hypothetical protein